jgi:hypothetical protein
VRRLRPELWRQKNWLLHHDNAPSHFLFSPGNSFTRTNITVVLRPPYSLDLAPCDFSLFPAAILTQLRLIEAESQAALNTHTEHDFQDVFKNW